MKKIEEKIQYKFRNKVWLVEALTHKSYIDTNKIVNVEFQDINLCNSTINQSDNTIN